MSYAESFLKAKGLQCTINKTPPTTSFVSMKKSTKSIRDLSAREAYWEGIILDSSNVLSGDIVDILSDRYLIQTVNPDPASKERSFYAVKSNAIVHHRQISEVVNSDTGDISSEWNEVHVSTIAFMEIVTYRMRQETPGLLDSTRYVIQVPKSVSAKLLDRFEYLNGNYEVVSIDNSAMDGISIIQLSTDIRA